MSNNLEPYADDRLIETAIPVEPRKKGQPVLAWIVIIALVGTIVFMHTASPSAEATVATEDMDVRIMGRIFVGMNDLYKQAGKSVGEKLFEAAKNDLDTGPLDRRLRFVVLAGELAGPAEANTQLKQLEDKLAEEGVQKTPEQAALMNTLQRLYEDYASGQLQAPAVTKEQRQQLRRDLGWFGDLALAPPGDPDKAARDAVISSARRTVIALVGIVLCLALVGLLGFVGLGVFVILLFSGKLRRGIQTGLSHGGIYAETFAVWMALFMGLSLGLEQLPVAANARWLLIGLASLLSLSALFWPVLRGIPWTQVRWEIGLRGGKQPPLEPAIGVATYAMALPMLAVGVVVMLLILMIEGALQGQTGTVDSFHPVHYPTHPVVEAVMKHDWWTRLQVLLLASVIAPIVEETMFRGVLYRHLREATGRWVFALSILFSALLVSFVFAVIHPQGLEAVPPLMGLAFTFCLVREWRGSLVPCMIAHGINNGIVLCFLFLALGD
jgi:membrane protease YdiL (CAAX protease family)